MCTHPDTRTAKRTREGVATLPAQVTTIRWCTSAFGSLCILGHSGTIKTTHSLPRGKEESHSVGRCGRGWRRMWVAPVTSASGMSADDPCSFILSDRSDCRCPSYQIIGLTTSAGLASGPFTSPIRQPRTPKFNPVSAAQSPGDGPRFS